MNSVNASSQPLKTVSPFYRWELLALLFLAYFFHQSDRAIYGIVATSIQDAFDLNNNTLYVTRTVMFTLMALIVPIAGYFGDRFNKRKLLKHASFAGVSRLFAPGA